MLPAALLAQGFGWRVAVGAPALIVLVMSGVALHALPAHRHWGCTEDDPRSRLVPGGLLPRKVTLGGVVKAYPHLLLLGLAYCFVKLARYLALLWLPLFLHERLGFSPPTAGFASTAFDAGGALGGGVWGTVADGRLLRGRRVCLAVPLCVMAGLGALGCAALRLPAAPGQSAVAGAGGSGGALTLVVASLGAFGFVLAGPETSLSGASVQDIVATHPFDISATASALVNGIGAIGPIAQGPLAAFTLAQAGWAGLFQGMGLCCGIASVLLVPIARSEARQYSGGGGKAVSAQFEGNYIAYPQRA